MHVLIFGVGGIGGFYGGLLARAGVEVSFVARGANLEALRAEGLTVERDNERFTISSLRVDDDPTRLPQPDLILLATKAYDLDNALRRLAPVVGENTVILPLLNGVDIPQRIAAVLGEGHVLPGLTYIPANRPRLGVVRQPGTTHPMVFGELNGGGRSERGEAILTLFRDAGLKAELAADIQKAVWTKYMLVTSNAGACGVTRTPIGPMIHDSETRALYRGICTEVEAVARARGVNLEPDVVERTIRHAEQTPSANKPSLLQDLEAGRPLELEILHGTLARVGREAGVPVPLATMTYAVLKPFMGGRGNA